MGVFFSDTFNIERDILENYGAFDVSLINDLPLFIDPFLLFHSEKPEYQELHDNIINYLIFLRDRANSSHVNEGLMKLWYCFPEVKQNWLGFSLVGNKGSGLGMNFAYSLHKNLGAIFNNFGGESITEGSHLEKVCLIENGVGRDSISDFVTNLILGFLCKYTEKFCENHLKEGQTRKVAIRRAKFNFETGMWESKIYRLPWHHDDYIILTPKDMLTRDENWINRGDMISDFDQIPSAIPDLQLRASVSQYFSAVLARTAKPKKPVTAKDRSTAASETIRHFPQLIDYYIKLKEINGEDAADLSAEKVLLTEIFFSQRMREILQPQLAQTDFYKIAGGTYAEAHQRLAYLKHAIEDQGCWRIFYGRDGKPIEREKDVQILFRLVWFGTPSDIGAEANDGRGPVDFKVSRGRHKTLVEIKLAKNSKIEANLQKQVEIYQQSADAERGIKVLIYFDYNQKLRIQKILERLKFDKNPDIVLIDARSDNKLSASNA